jgi:hypothetical protein
MVEDSHCLIYDWIPPNTELPIQVDRRAYAACHACSQTFRRKPIHCQLCGEMFDERCTARYRLPEKFTKGRTDPVRICFSCRNRCMAWRDQQLGVNLTDARRPLLKCDLVAGVLAIYPPAEWTQADANDACKTCDRSGLKRHHCLACGELYCNDCSSKMIVPDAFNKKRKTGPQRICDECRFLLISGAVLSEPSAISDKRKPFRNVFDRRSVNSTVTTLPAVTPSEQSVVLRIVWHHSQAVMAEVKCGLNWDLDVIDKIVKSLDAVVDVAYVYTFQQKPIAVEHWTAFTAKILKPDLVIRAANSFTIRWTLTAQ